MHQIESQKINEIRSQLTKQGVEGIDNRKKHQNEYQLQTQKCDQYIKIIDKGEKNSKQGEISTYLKEAKKIIKESESETSKYYKIK